MVVVRAPVLKEPVVPVPPPPEEVHEVLLVEDQLTVVLAPFAIEVEVAETDMTGRLLMIGAAITIVEPSPPPHEARPEITISPVKKGLSRSIDRAALLLDITISFNLKYSI